MTCDVMYKGFDIEVAIIPPTGLVFGDVQMHPAVSLGTIDAVVRTLWFQSLYAEADF